MDGIYLDHAATTPLDPRVLEVMLPYLKESFGNASSVHGLGRKARFAIEESRERVAALLGAEPGEIIFTSGGTEANNTALRSVEGAIVTCAAEHESVLRPAERLKADGRCVVVMQPDATGIVTSDRLSECLAGLDAGAGLVSIMHGNNELGTLSPIRNVVDVAHTNGFAVHCDAVQTAGYGLIRCDEVDVDLMTVSGHKFYGPKGVGVLFVRGGVELRPLVEGGAQERGRRGGTENVAAIVGFAEALRLAIENAKERLGYTADLRERLRSAILASVGDRVVINTPVARRDIAPHILNIAATPVAGEPIDGEMLLLNLDMEGIHASAGSACTSGAVEPSHVLRAIRLPADTARAAVRFSVGKDTSEQEIDRAVEALTRVLSRMHPAGAGS